MSDNELEFYVFCIESFAAMKGVDARKVYDVFKSEKINDYIINNFDILHTQGKQYIVSDLSDVCNERGIKF